MFSSITILNVLVTSTICKDTTNALIETNGIFGENGANKMKWPELCNVQCARDANGIWTVADRRSSIPFILSRMCLSSIRRRGSKHCHVVCANYSKSEHEMFQNGRPKWRADENSNRNICIKIDSYFQIRGLDPIRHRLAKHWAILYFIAPTPLNSHHGLDSAHCSPELLEDGSSGVSLTARLSNK